MTLTPLWTIARQELVITVRNRWTGIFAVVFALLVTGVATAGILAEGFSGMQNFTRTSASLLNLILYLIPLVALIMGTLSFTGDGGAAELLFSQPVPRTTVLLGKLLGIFLSLTLSTLAGFAAAGGVIAAAAGTEGLARYAGLVLLSLMLALIFVVLSMLVAAANRRKGRAFGVALVLWFVLALFYDLLVLAGSALLQGSHAATMLFLSIFGNPVDLVRVAALIILENITIFGAAGAALMRFLGGPAWSMVLLGAALLVWVIVPLTIAIRLVRGQDI